MVILEKGLSLRVKTFSIVFFLYKPKKLAHHILVKSKSGFTASTDFSIGQKGFITTINFQKKAPRLSIWLWAQIGMNGAGIDYLHRTYIK